MVSTFRTLPPFSKPLAFAALADLRSPKVSNTDESLYSFVSRRFGTEVAKYAVDPMARGIFAGNARELSVKSIGKYLHECEQAHGGVLKGVLLKSLRFHSGKDEVMNNKLVKRARREKWAVWSLEAGLETLVKALHEDIIEKGVSVETNCIVSNINKNSRNTISIQTSSEEVEVDHLISCIPAVGIGSLSAFFNADLENLLKCIPFVTVGVVNIEFSGTDLVRQPAFGYLVPSTENNKVLGVIFDTCCFPVEDKTVFTVMMGGYWFESIFGSKEHPDEDKVYDIAINELKTTLGITAKPSNYKVSILSNCIPQYNVGHAECVENARKLVKHLKLPLYLAGNSYDGPGINDSIQSAKVAVLQLREAIR